MRTVGIIAEYNPFHSGHEYHLKEAKKKSGADYAVIVMSPDFVQRGTRLFLTNICARKWHFAPAQTSCSSCPSAMPAEARNFLRKAR